MPAASKLHFKSAFRDCVPFDQAAEARLPVPGDDRDAGVSDGIKPSDETPSAVQWPPKLNIDELSNGSGEVFAALERPV